MAYEYRSVTFSLIKLHVTPMSIPCARYVIIPYMQYLTLCMYDVFEPCSDKRGLNASS